MTAFLNPLKYAAHLNKVTFKQLVPTTQNILNPMIIRGMKAVRCCE